MHYPTSSTSRNSLAGRLPFRIDDTHAVNHLFLRWRRLERVSDKHLIDIWTYCYVNRYFRLKTGELQMPARFEQDHLVAMALAKVRQNLDGVDRPDRFSHWVSVICEHTLINHIRQRQEAVSLERYPKPLPAPRSRRTGRYHDAEITYGTLNGAITRLPRSLRRPARLRFMHGLSYEEISDHLGKPVSTVRTYVHRATRSFKKNPSLRVLRDEILHGA